LYSVLYGCFDVWKKRKTFFWGELLGQVSYQDRWGDPGVAEQLGKGIIAEVSIFSGLSWQLVTAICDEGDDLTLY